MVVVLFGLQCFAATPIDGSFRISEATLERIALGSPKLAGLKKNVIAELWLLISFDGGSKSWVWLA